MEERLQKILAAAGVGSRRHCETLIATGRVAVNGQTVTELGTKADPLKDKISVDGRPITSAEKKVYILLNKPVGYTSTRSDPHAEHTVLELLKGVKAYLYPVGRLDVDTSGLLLLTNDGDFAQLLTHPSHEIDKTYVAVVRGRVSRDELTKLEKGVLLDDGMTAPARARLLSSSPGTNTSRIEIIIHEGRKRQVKRMFKAIGHDVLELKRTRLGGLDLGDLKEGDYRYLTGQEVVKLKKQASGVKGATGKSRGAR